MASNPLYGFRVAFIRINDNGVRRDIKGIVRVSVNDEAVALKKALTMWPITNNHCGHRVIGYTNTI